MTITSKSVQNAIQKIKAAIKSDLEEESKFESLEACYTRKSDGWVNESYVKMRRDGYHMVFNNDGRAIKWLADNNYIDLMFTNGVFEEVRPTEKFYNI